jgi:hypothetical protein
MHSFDKFFQIMVINYWIYLFQHIYIHYMNYSGKILTYVLGILLDFITIFHL